MTKFAFRGSLLLTIGGLLVGCAEPQRSESTCDLARPQATCGGGLVCEDVGGHPACVAPLLVSGRVFDPSGAGIPGALVTATDANDAPMTGTATTGADGSYQLRVPAPRSTAGAPLLRQIRLRGAAAGFAPFPSGLRRSLPLELSGAAGESGGRLILASAATDLLLEPLPGAATWGSIAGAVAGPDGARGALVVAEGPSTVTSISDSDGAFVIFNVTPGMYTVRGYAAGVQLQPRTVAVTAGARAAGVNLEVRAAALGRVSGSVNIVDAPGGSMTSVVLVVASTFNQALLRGEVPPGLRAPGAGAPSINGPFSIDQVPDGDYVVLAAFENDALVRDPDTAIGGTQIQRVTVGDSGREIALSGSFKITEALAIVRPGAGETPDLMTGPPTFVWKDDSSEERYALEVRDAQGNVVWSNDQIPKQTGGDVSVAYGGPALPPASLFQFRVTSFRKGNVAISQTEDLRGVFRTP